MHTLTIGNTTIRLDDSGLISLNDIYSAACAQHLADGKLDPRAWGRALQEKKSGSSGKASTSGGPGRDFIDFVACTLNVNAAHIYKTRRGVGGGTYAHWQIALAYAKYLSPELHMQVNDVYMRAKAGDVTLADEIADKATPEQQAWLAKRIQGKVVRNQFTETLSRHGVTGKGFADCTNAIYRPILGGKKSEICRANGIPNKPGTNLRDLMTIDQLVATSMAELVSAKQIKKFNITGNTGCAIECDRAARNVASLMQ